MVKNYPTEAKTSAGFLHQFGEGESVKNLGCSAHAIKDSRFEYYSTIQNGVKYENKKEVIMKITENPKRIVIDPAKNLHLTNGGVKYLHQI